MGGALRAGGGGVVGGGGVMGIAGATQDQQESSLVTFTAFDSVTSTEEPSLCFK